MKSLNLLTLIFFLSTGLLSGQIVITEIMYNPPEAGQDSLEYIELYNPNDFEIDMTGYYFSDGIEHAFDDGVIFPGDSYMVLAKSASAMLHVFGVVVDEWKSGALNNKGEPIVLNNASGDIIAAVTYKNDGEWPSEADGNGHSLEICNIHGSQGDPANWSYSNTSTGIFINNKEVFGSPGKANSSICSGSADYIIVGRDFEFSPNDLIIGKGETVLWNIVGGTHNINGSQDSHPGNPEGFHSGNLTEAPWTFSHTFNELGTYIYHSDANPGEMIGKIIVIEDLYPFYLIREVIGTDADGVADSIGVKCTLTGIVSTPSYRVNDLTFVIQEDDKHGITVFGPGSLGYQAMPGDEIIVKGTIAQFNGLTEIEADSIFLISSDNTVFGPVTADAMTEENENTLIKMLDMTLVDPGQWRTEGSFNVDISNGSETFLMRIYDGLGFAGKGAPEGTFDVVGAVGQFDSSIPYLEGYQLLPRGPEDIDPYDVTGPSYPKYEIAEVVNNGPDGRPDSLGVSCILEGIVIRGNFRSRGYQFVMTDMENSAGITVFNSDDINNYRPESGDIIEVTGTIAFYNGLTEIEIIDIQLLSSGNSLPEPMNVEELGENTESRYIRLNNASFLDLSPWSGNGASFNKDIQTLSGNKYIMRVDQNTSLASSAIDLSEKGWENFVNITGVGTQFDNSAPYNKGYQIMPFDEGDIVRSTVSVEYSAEELGINAFPNPVGSILTIESENRLEKVDFFDSLGRIVINSKETGNRSVFNLEALSPGLYYLRVYTIEGATSIKLIKE